MGRGMGFRGKPLYRYEIELYRFVFGSCVVKFFVQVCFIWVVDIEFCIRVYKLPHVIIGCKSSS